MRIFLSRIRDAAVETVVTSWTRVPLVDRDARSFFLNYHHRFDILGRSSFGEICRRNRILFQHHHNGELLTFVSSPHRQITACTVADQILNIATFGVMSLHRMGVMTCYSLS